MAFFTDPEQQQKCLKIWIKTQKIPKRQRNTEIKMQLEESESLTLDYTAKHQLSKKYGTVTKVEIYINGVGQKAQK